MSGLSEEERRSITLSWPHTVNGYLACRCGGCVRKVESTVEAIVAARVKAAKVEALREAADAVVSQTVPAWFRARADRIEGDQ